MPLLGLILTACSGKYLVKTYPAGAKVYIQDLQTKERKLVGLSPVQIKEESRLGDVFFLNFEKDNYQPKKVIVKVNPGESLTLAARLDPLVANQDESRGDGKGGEKKDDQKPQPGKPPEKKKEAKQELEEQVEDLNLRVALLENTMSFYKDAMFSPRFRGGPARFDRDRNDKVIGHMFQAQQSIVQGNYIEALKKIDEALKLDEYVSNAWLLKGSVKYLMKDYDGARSAWERTLKLDGHNKVAYRYLNEVYKKLGINELPKKASELRYPSSQVEIEKRNRKR
jgi:tetratricopeptide (TPR) repeat protein